MVDFEDIKIGDKVSFKVEITEEMHNRFGQVSGDMSPVHTDKDFCRNTRFNKPIGYGFMLNSLLSKLYGEYLPGGSSICIKQESKFPKPYYVGDIIEVIAEVKNKLESTRFVEIETRMLRNGGECVFRGTGTVQVLFSRKEALPLFKSEGTRIYYKDFVDALKEVGVSEGDSIFVHSDIVSFGKLAIRDRNFLLSSIIESLKESVGGEGTVVMPAFSYSFCNGEVFDVEGTRTSVGTLNEYFRKAEGVNRTIHPIFSCAVWGKNAQSFLDVGKDSFDDSSIFGKLKAARGKVVFLGADINSCTFIHHIEQLHGVPYRFVKKFEGKIKNQEEEFDDYCTFYVRNLDKNPLLDLSRFKEYLIQKNIIKTTTLGNGTIICADLTVMFEKGCKLLDDNIFFFLRQPV